MSDYDISTTWTLDTQRFVEGLLEVDGSGIWKHTKLAAMPEGAVIGLTLKFASISDMGAISYFDIPDDTLISLTGKELKQGRAVGEVLIGESEFTVNESDGDYEGVLSLNTDELRAAMGSFQSLPIRFELIVLNADETLRGIWTHDVEVQRKVYCADPTTPVDADTYYTAAQADAYFARKDAPTGYGQKLVTIDGLLFWAMLVGSTWVVPRIVKIDSRYYTTYTEVA